MVAASRKHGPFDTRWPSPFGDSSVAAQTAPPLPAVETAEALDWRTFSNRYFAGRRRHHMEALTAYANYKQGREWRTPARLSVVPTKPVSADVELARDRAGTRRLLAALATNQQ